jgi:transposase
MVSNDRQHREAKVRSLQQYGTLNRRPERVGSELFRQSGFFDSQDLMQVKYEMLRAAEQDRRSVSHVTREFGLCRPAFYHAREDFAKRGLAGLLPRKRGPRAGHKLTPPVLAFLEQLTRCGEADDPEQVCARMRVEFGIQVHVRTVRRALRRLGEKKGRRP